MGNFLSIQFRCATMTMWIIIRYVPCRSDGSKRIFYRFSLAISVRRSRRMSTVRIPWESIHHKMDNWVSEHEWELRASGRTKTFFSAFVIFVFCSRHPRKWRKYFWNEHSIDPNRNILNGFSFTSILCVGSVLTCVTARWTWFRLLAFNCGDGNMHEQLTKWQCNSTAYRPDFVDVIVMYSSRRRNAFSSHTSSHDGAIWLWKHFAGHPFRFLRALSGPTYGIWMAKRLSRHWQGGW